MHIKENRWNIRTNNTIRFNQSYANYGMNYELDDSSPVKYVFNKHDNWSITRFRKIKYKDQLKIFAYYPDNSFKEIKIVDTQNDKKIKTYENKSSLSILHSIEDPNSIYDTTHDVIFRYHNYRRGRSVIPDIEMYYFGRHTNGVYKSRHLEGFNSFTKQGVMIGKYLQVNGYGSRSRVKSLIITENYPVFIDVYRKNEDMVKQTKKPYNYCNGNKRFQKEQTGKKKYFNTLMKTY